MLLALVFAAPQTAAVPVSSPSPSPAPRFARSGGPGFALPQAPGFPQTALLGEARRYALAGLPRIGL